MKKIIRGLFVAALVLASSSAFCEEWRICLGSFNVREYADDRVKILKDRGIDSVVREIYGDDGKKFYRVIYSESFGDSKSVAEKRDSLADTPILKELEHDTVWYYKVTSSTDDAK